MSAARRSQVSLVRMTSAGLRHCSHNSAGTGDMALLSARPHQPEPPPSPVAIPLTAFCPRAHQPEHEQHDDAASRLRPCPSAWRGTADPAPGPAPAWLAWRCARGACRPPGSRTPRSGPDRCRSRRGPGGSHAAPAGFRAEGGAPSTAPSMPGCRSGCWAAASRLDGPARGQHAMAGRPR